jgi:hypothetical protein
MSMAHDAIPVELRERAQWVVWKRERRGNKWTKVPYRAIDARTYAKCDDPRTWGTFEQAVAAPTDRVHGIGYVFSADDPFTGLDLDACIDQETGELHPVAAEILGDVGGYQERSPSGTGMHAIIAGKLNGDRNRTSDTPWGGVFEVYDRLRFFTVTGNGSGAIVERQAQLDALVVQMFGEPSPNGGAPARDSEDDGPGRSVEALIAAYPKLGVIAERTGKAPKDRTASGWDHYLTCEGVRNDLRDGELGAMIRHARGDDLKGERADYITRTIDTARKEVADEQANPATRISRRWNLGNDQVESGWTRGDLASGEAIVYLKRRSGRVLRFPKLGDLFDPRKHTKLVSQIARTQFAPLSNEDAVKIAQAIIELCGGEDANPTDEARQWISDFLTDVGAIVDVKAYGSDAERWAGLVSRRSAEEKFKAQRTAASRSVAMRDERGDLWLAATPLKTYSEPGVGWPLFGARLAEIGWRREEVDMHAPGTAHSERSAERRIHTVFYVGKDDQIK